MNTDMQLAIHQTGSECCNKQQVLSSVAGGYAVKGYVDGPLCIALLVMLDVAF